jgi:hypothetical protein
MSRPSTIVIVGAGPNGLLVAGPPARPAIPHLQPQSNLVNMPGRTFLESGAAPPTCRTRRVIHLKDTQWAVRPELRGVWHPRAA